MSRTTSEQGELPPWISHVTDDGVPVADQEYLKGRRRGYHQTRKQPGAPPPKPEPVGWLELEDGKIARISDLTGLNGKFLLYPKGG